MHIFVFGLATTEKQYHPSQVIPSIMWQVPIFTSGYIKRAIVEQNLLSREETNLTSTTTYPPISDRG